jgi:hypothetical protein
MPDLHDALAAEAERRRPAEQPAFGKLVERRRRRDLRRRGAAGAALAGLAIAGVAFVPDLVGQPSPETIGPAGSLSPELRDFVEKCIAGERNISATDTFVGLTEKELSLRRSPLIARIVGRDGQCLDRTDDLRPGRLNLIIQDGKVVWAGIEADQQTENVLFRVTYLDGAQYDAATDDAALFRCAGLPGARMGVTLPVVTPIRSVSVSGTPAEVGAVEQCLRELPNTRVEREQVTTSGPELAALVAECIGSDANIVETTSYVGLTETQLAELRGPARNVRVVARDGECLDRDRALVDGRINLIVNDGRIVWAGVERLR